MLTHLYFSRLWTAPLTHGSDLHLYYNMLSLAWKGYKLESHHGSVVFLLLLTLFTFSSGLIYVLLSILAADILEDQSYMHQVCKTDIFFSFSGNTKILLYMYKWKDLSI